MFNIYQLQLLAPIFLILGLYIKSIIFSFFCILLILGFYNRLHFHIIKVLIFFCIGNIRQFFIPLYDDYSYKYTSFTANVLDYQIREKKQYLLLANFKYYPLHSALYDLDEEPVFPNEALMEIDNVESYCNAKIVQCVGRFYLPMAMNPDVKIFYKPRGVIKSCHILSYKHQTFKDYFRKKFRKYLNKDAANFSSAIFLGDTFAIHSNMRKVFEQAGLAHVLGVSILNLSILLLLFFYIFYYLIGMFFWKSTWYLPLSVSSKLCSLCVILFYCYLIGFEYPLLRSVFMTLFSVVIIWTKHINHIEILLLSAAFLLFVQPLAIFDLSFQLSFGGVLGIFALGHIKFKYSMLNLLWSTFSASLLIVPLSIFHFQQVCLQPFLSNLCVLPYLNFIVIPSLLLFMILPGYIAGKLAFIIDYEFLCLSKMVTFLADISWNICCFPVDYSYFLFCFGCFLLFAILKERLRYAFLMIGYLGFLFGMKKAYDKVPFILVNMSAIGLVLKDKIFVYPKVNSVGRIWGEYYNLPVFDGVNIGIFKEDSKKVIVKNIGIIRSKRLSTYCLDTKIDYVFLPEELKSTKVVVIENSRKEEVPCN